MKRVQLKVETRSQDIGAEKARCTRLFKRRFKLLVDREDFAVNIVVADGDAHRVRRNRHAFDQHVRVVAQDVAIFEGTRFAFV